MQKVDTPALYPGQNWWLTTQEESYLISEPLELLDSHQFSIEFEVFPIEPTFRFSVIFIEDWANPNPMKITFSDWYIRFDNPYSFRDGSRIKAQKWTRITITLSRLESSNRSSVTVYYEDLTPYGSPPSYIQKSGFTFMTSSFGIRGSTLQIGAFNYIGLFKSLKYYRYAINRKTIQDLSPPMQEVGDFYYNFQEEYYDNYYKYFAEKNVSISSTLNS